jgi:protein-tyrosine phosphatase
MPERSVLFVCLGNICRSPAAERVFRQLLREQNLEERFAVDSAGTLGYHAGRPADPRMRQSASRRQILLEGRARQVRLDDLERFDWVLAMDRENLAELQRLQPNPQAQLRLFSDFLDPAWPIDVPDPYYGGDDGFEYVLDMLQAGCPRLLEELLKRPAPPGPEIA